MKKKIFLIGYLLFTTLTFSQSWIDVWQESTISFGIIDSIKYNNNGKDICRKYYRIIGSGAMFYVKVDTIVIPTIVTAKHIFSLPEENWSPHALNVRFSWDDDKTIFDYFGMQIPLVNGNEKLWFPHPDNNVDLACFPLIYPNIHVIDKKLSILPYSILATQEDLFQGAKIFVLGYPASIGAEYWNKALLREGIISWIAPKSDNKSKLLIDCEVFPGNSGGPVFKVPTGIGRDGSFQVGGQVKFIGIVSQRRFSETPVKIGQEDVTDAKGKKLYSLESIGIGVVEPAIRVRELLDNMRMILNRK
ncbi:MAG: serine protease [Ignavibacteria bacterium]|nr:serine protease [Ignavibacteria bacterium]